MKGKDTLREQSNIGRLEFKTSGTPLSNTMSREAKEILGINNKLQEVNGGKCKAIYPFSHTSANKLRNDQWMLFS